MLLAPSVVTKVHKILSGSMESGQDGLFQPKNFPSGVIGLHWFGVHRKNLFEFRKVGAE